MKLNDYQESAESTAVFEGDITYPILGLNGEAGEVAESLKKYLRGDYDYQEMCDRLLSELGDVLWYVAVTAYRAGWTLEEVANVNLSKLAARRAAGTIRGDGEVR